MFAVMPLPVFHGGGDAAITSPYRPAASSPLSSSSSSPVRASSPPPALAHRDPNALPRRDVQSSLTRGSPSAAAAAAAPPSKFRFAARPARPNPAVRRREDATDDRRRLFLQNVRRRAEDQRWEQRGGEQELFKLEWLSMDRELRRAKESDAEGMLTEAEMEEAQRIREEEARAAACDSPDEMMVDAMALEEEAELDALVSSMEREAPAPRPDSPHFSEDEDYDSLFMDLLSQSGSPDLASSGQMDMS